MFLEFVPSLRHLLFREIHHDFRKESCVSFAERIDNELLNRLSFNAMISTQNEDTKVLSPFRKEKKEKKIKN